MRRPAHKWIFLVLMISVSLATSTLADTLKVTESQITSSADYETTPTLGNDGSTDLVVYTRRSIPMPGTIGPCDIWYQRLVGGAQYGPPVQVTNDPILDEVLNDHSGDYISYTAYDDVAPTTSGCIKLYQISTNTTYQLGCADVIRESKIFLSNNLGDRVVWIEGSVFESKIMSYPFGRLGTGDPASEIYGPAPIFDLKIGSNYMVWSELIDGQYDVFYWPLIAILSSPANLTNTQNVDEVRPATSGPWIVWEERQDGTSSRIKAQYGSATPPIIVADNGARNWNPSIDGDLVTWESDLTGNFEIWLYRISTGESFQVTDDTADQYLNNVFDNMVAYVDMRGGSEDVYVSTLEFIPPPCADLGGDTDGDGVCNDNDDCPNDNAMGFDADGDGCVDSLSGLTDIVSTLADSGVIDDQMVNSLLSKIENAEQSATKDNICTAINQLEAFKNQIEAQRGKKISDEAADLLIAYADNSITQLLSQLSEGESC